MGGAGKEQPSSYINALSWRSAILQSNHVIVSLLGRKTKVLSPGTATIADTQVLVIQYWVL